MNKKYYYEKKKVIISNKTDVVLNVLKILTKELSEAKTKKYQKEHNKNNKELILENARNKYKSLTEDKKQKNKRLSKAI